MRPPESDEVFRAFRRRQSSRGGFTLVEALTAITLTTMAAGAVLLGSYSAVQTTEVSVEQTIAMGMAEQVVDEVLGTRYHAVGAGAYQTPLGPNSVEMAGNGRSLFNDTDDYHGFQEMPPEDRFGMRLGQGDGAGGLRHPNFMAPPFQLANWEQEIDVYYVDENDTSVRLSGSQTSNFRAVDVRIHFVKNGSRRTLARVRRVFAYLPPPQ